MGFFDFIKDAGAKMLGNDEASIKSEINDNNATMPIEDLDVKVDGETVVLSGSAKSAEDRAKAALIAGNVKGVSKVLFEDVSVEEGEGSDDTVYEIKKGDTLWKIATTYYKNGARYPEIVEANLEVIKDADKIYPGQLIRIPNV